jgi:hypothetical protein
MIDDQISAMLYANISKSRAAAFHIIASTWSLAVIT